MSEPQVVDVEPTEKINYLLNKIAKTEDEASGYYSLTQQLNREKAALSAELAKVQERLRDAEAEIATLRGEEPSPPGLPQATPLLPMEVPVPQGNTPEEPKAAEG